MNEKNTQELCKKYPLIFMPRPGTVSRRRGFAFCHGDGWYSILDALCEALYSPYRAACRQYESLRAREGQAPWRPDLPVISAVDVERARLEMARTRDEIPQAVQVKEKFGTLRFYVDGGNERSWTLIELAEGMSERTCEVCGAPGTIRRGGWIRTLCDEHHKAPEQ